MNADHTKVFTDREDKDMLRVFTCGSVDDGKSTLIGRLLCDANLLYKDRLDKAHADSLVHGTAGDAFDPALLTDGLKAEREQGITIDVSYQYFTTRKRKFIIADCPGHEQYTRNMVTGASGSDIAVILVDATRGITTQTKRHSFICSVLGIRNAVVVINKMDKVDWSQQVYEELVEEYNSFAARFTFSNLHFIPISALYGDNVVDSGGNESWYNNVPLLQYLEDVSVVTNRNLIDTRLPIQRVLRPDSGFRGYCGTLASGVLTVGDEVVYLPSKQTAKIKQILDPVEDIHMASSGQAITVTLDKEIDISRGGMLVPVNNVPHVSDYLEAMVVWMDIEPLMAGYEYYIKHLHTTTLARVEGLRYVMSIVDLSKMSQTIDGAPFTKLEMNEIGRCAISLDQKIAFDPYQNNRATGGFIIINRSTNATVGCGVIMDRMVAGTEYKMCLGQKEANMLGMVLEQGKFKLSTEQERIIAKQMCKMIPSLHVVSANNYDYLKYIRHP
jgi:bifunctional enzyme CysN/CysC